MTLPAKTASRRLARILSDTEALPDEDILALQRKFPDEYLGDVLVREKILLPGYLRELLIRALCIPWLDVDGCTVPSFVAELLSEPFCREHRVMPISWVREVFTLACVNPLDEETLNEVRYATALNVRTVLCSDEQLEVLIEKTFAKPETAEGEDEPPADGEPVPEPEAAQNSPQAAPDVSEMARQLASQLSEGTNTPPEMNEGEPEDGSADDANGNSGK